MKRSLYLFLFLGSLILWGAVATLVFTTKPSDVTVITHLSATGKVTTSKSVTDLYLLFAINLIMILGIFVMSLYPEKMNYPVIVNDDNRERLYYRMKIFLGVVCSAVTLLLMSLASQSLNWVKLDNELIALGSVVFFCFLLPIMLLFFRDDSSSKTKAKSTS